MEFTMRVMVEVGLVVVALIVGYFIGRRTANRSVRLPFGESSQGGGRKTIAR
jgi:hypothetical protein